MIETHLDTSKKIPSVQALRAIAFLGVFFCHCGVVWPDFGGWGVSVFLVLSGFLLATKHYNLEYTNWKQSVVFAWNHIKKIYPLHIIMLFVVWGFEFSKAMIGISNGVKADMLVNTILDVFLLQAWIPVKSVFYSINGVAWYLSAILFCYLVFPCLITVVRKAQKENRLILVPLILFIIQMVLIVITMRIPGFYDNRNLDGWMG